MEKFLTRLNPPQREAVLHKDGPLLILAGAGSGKTSTMATRIAYLIAKHHVNAENILGLSFTRKAAGELKERVIQMVSKVSGGEATFGLTLSTFHSLCAQILRKNGSELGYSSGFSILNESDQISIFKSIFKLIKLDDRKFDLQVIRFHIGQAKNRFLDPQSASHYFLTQSKMSEDYAIMACHIYERYQERLLSLNALDFDDLVFQSVRLLELSKKIRDHYQSQFKYILVDEYQDTNEAQFELLNLLIPKKTKTRSQNICVVGDDDQSIYGWRGADSTHILQFQSHFKDAKIITLDQNYRSTKTILDAANQVIEKNKKRHPKKLWSQKEEGHPLLEIIVEDDAQEVEVVADEILKRTKGSDHPLLWKDFAILYRSNPQSRLFEEALRLKQIPYKIVGTLSFLERFEVKNILSYWKALQNPKDDVSLRRIINWPSRGIGKTTLDRLQDLALKEEKSVFEVIEGLATASSSSPLSEKAHHALTLFFNLFQQLRSDLQTHTLMNWGKKTLQDLGIKKFLFDQEENPKVAQRQWENIEELLHAMGQIEKNHPTEILLSEFLQRMTLDPNEADQEEDTENKNQVTLLTLHGSKGLEFPIVFLVGMEEGFLPHQRSIDEAQDLSEERRLCYVGITRAQKELIFTRARSRIRYGKAVPRNPSRFLQDIPRELILSKNLSLDPKLDSPKEQGDHEKKVREFMASLKKKIEKNH